MHNQGAFLQEKILKVVITIGLIITIVGSSLNIFLGLPIYSIFHHIIGAVVLIVSWARIQRQADIRFVSVLILGYYCFIFTPFNWIFLDGVNGNTFYIAYVFVVLIILLLADRVRTIILTLYVSLLVVLSGVDIVKFLSREDSLFENGLLLTIFSAFIMLVGLIYILTAFRNRYDSQQHRLYELAIRDHMTNAYNLRYMEGAINNQCELVNRNEDYTFSLAISDIDKFKKVNDTYGHSVGNDVITSHFIFLHDTIGDRGIVGRLGGDEFIIIFPGIDKDEAFNLMGSLNSSNSTKMVKRIDIPLTMSVGVCDSREQQTLEGLLQLTDKRLYKAKEQGRDTIVCC